MKELNFVKILQNFIGKKFWNPVYGYITLLIANDDYLIFSTGMSSLALLLNTDGTIPDTGVLGVYPSRYKSDWNEFIKEHNISL